MKKLNFTLIGIFLLVCTSLQAQTENLSDADFQIRQGNYRSAINMISQYIELNPSASKAYIKRAMVYEMLGQSTDKERDLQYANYLNPLAFMHISENTRSQHYAKKNYSYAFNANSEDFKKSPVKNRYYELYLKDNLNLHSQDSLILDAIFFLSQNNLDNAEDALSKIEPNDNILGILYDLYGLVDLKKDRVEEAIIFFTKSIESMPNFPLAYHNRAIAYKLSGNYEAAERDLMRALELNEDISVFYFTLAKLSERLDSPIDAIKYYEKAIDKDPDYVEARTNYSLLQKTLGNYDKSILELREIARTGKDKSKTHFINGGIFMTYGEYRKAINEFESYLQINADDSDAIFNKGLAKILMGVKKDGCKDISLSIDIEQNTNRQQILTFFCPDY